MPQKTVRRTRASRMGTPSRAPPVRKTIVRAPKKPDRRGRGRRTRIELLLKRITVILAIALLLVVAYSAILLYAASLMEGADVKVERITILSSDEDSLELEIQARITNPTAADADIGSSNIRLMYGGRPAGTLRLPSFGLEPGVNTILLRVRLDEGSPRTLQALASAVMGDGPVKVLLKGTLPIKGLIPLRSTLNREVVLDPGEGISVGLERIRIEDGPDSINIHADVSVVNPTILETTLEGLALNMIFQRTVLATHHTTGFLKRGENEIQAVITIGVDVVGEMKALTTLLSRGEPAALRIVGASTGNSLLSRLSTVYEAEVSSGDLAELDDFSYDFRSISVREEADGISAQLGINLYNPSPIEAPLTGIGLDIYALNATLGTALIVGSLVQGQNLLSASLHIPDGSINDTGDLLDSLASGGSPRITIRGNGASGTYLGELSKAFETSPSSSSDLIDMSSFGLTLMELHVPWMNETGIPALITASIDPPVELDLPTDGLGFQVSEGESAIANGSITGNLTGSEYTVSADILALPSASPQINTIIAQALGGESPELTVSGIDLNTSLSRLLSRISLQFTVDMASEPDVNVSTIYLESLGILTATIGIDITADLPMPITINISTTQFDAYYNGDLLGPIEVNATHIVQGHQAISARVHITWFSILQVPAIIIDILAGGQLEMDVVTTQHLGPDNAVSFTITVPVLA